MAETFVLSLAVNTDLEAGLRGFAVMVPCLLAPLDKSYHLWPTITPSTYVFVCRQHF